MFRPTICIPSSRIIPSKFFQGMSHVRFFSSTLIHRMGDYEQKIYDILKTELIPKKLEVKDVSGGCGSMFAIQVESEKFKNLSMIKQHRIINEILKDEISKWHGLQLRTKAA